MNPTTAARTAKHMTTVVFHLSSHQKRRPPMADTTLADANLGATPKTTPLTEPTCTILALDLGTTTGWAIRGYDGLITSGTVSFKPGRYDGGGMRYLRFTNWLSEIDRLSGPIEAIYFEEVRRHAGTDAAHVFGGLLAVLTSWGELRGVPYQGVPVGTIKKFLTGQGNANKQAMIDAARKRGFSPADDNEVDAIAILLWAIETQGGLA
jgi:hypothetical protein